MNAAAVRAGYDLATVAQLAAPHVSRRNERDVVPAPRAVRVASPQDATVYDRLQRDPEVRAALAQVPRLVRPIVTAPLPLAQRIRERL